MVNKVVIPNDTDIIVVSMGDEGNEIQFASDLKSNLENFKLGSIDSGCRSILFEADGIDFSTDIKKVRRITYDIYFGYKVLIRNKKIVDIDCTPLIDHNILILK